MPPRRGEHQRRHNRQQQSSFRTSFFVLEEVVPSVLEQMPVGLGTSPLLASPLTNMSPGIEHLSTTVRLEASSPRRAAEGFTSSSLQSVANGTFDDPLKALEYYDATTTAPRVVYAAAALRRRRVEAQRREEATAIRAAVPLSQTVTQRLSDHQLPSSVASRATLFSRLGVVAAQPKARPEVDRVYSSHRQARNGLRPIEARIIPHQRHKWGFDRDEKLFFKPSHRTPEPNFGDSHGLPPPATHSGAQELTEPLMQPVCSVICGRPRSALSTDHSLASVANQLSASRHAARRRVELGDALHEAHLLAINAEQLLQLPTKSSMPQTTL